MQKHNLTCDNKNVFSQWKKILLASAIKINQKIGLLKNHRDSFCHYSRCELEIQKSESASRHVWDRKKKTTQGVCVLCLSSVAGRGGARKSGEGNRGEEGKREEVFSHLPSLRPKICGTFLVTASPAIRSRLSLFYLSQRTHAVSQTHIWTLPPAHTACAALIYS